MHTYQKLNKKERICKKKGQTSGQEHTQTSHSSERKIGAISTCQEMSDVKETAVLFCTWHFFYKTEGNFLLFWSHCIFFFFVCVCMLQGKEGRSSNHIFNGSDCRKIQSRWPHSWGLMHFGTFWSDEPVNNFCLCGLMLINTSCCWLNCRPALIRTT